MKNNQLNKKFLNKIEDEISRKIFVTIVKGKDYKTSRDKLAQELGMSKKAITTKYLKQRGIIVIPDTDIEKFLNETKQK